MITFMYHYGDWYERLINQVPVFIGFILIFLVARINFPKVTSTVKLPTPNLRVLYFLSFFIILYIMFEFRDVYSIVSFDKVYDQRDVASESSLLSGYLILWISYFIGPLIFIIGLINKNKKQIIYGFFSVVFIYGVSASKITLFIPLVIYLVYYLYKKHPKTSIMNTLGLSFSGLCLFFMAISHQFFLLSAVILMRTFGIAGLLTYQYNEFFKVHEKTYLSHINIVNAITGGYKYKNSLGMEVSEYFVGDGVTNANANFIATDGMASFGLPGVIFICIILGLYFAFTKSQISSSNGLLLGLLFIPFCFIILNVGLFTSLLSGGFIFLNLYFIFFKSSK
ncbi:hypothetical protein [Chryseobacterium sp. 22458]|uniref:hypothetical protein n=1 Tax=Chryseobacterium sp. 22458 TaxID=3453921 RepID=UPI003F84E7A8